MRSLDSLRVIYACPLAWEKLTGRGRERFCEQCQQSVHDLYGLDEQQVVEFLEQQEAPVCARIEARLLSRPTRESATAPALAGVLGTAALTAALVAARPPTVEEPPVEAEQAPLQEYEGERAHVVETKKKRKAKKPKRRRTFTIMGAMIL